MPLNVLFPPYYFSRLGARRRHFWPARCHSRYCRFGALKSPGGLKAPNLIFQHPPSAPANFCRVLGLASHFAYQSTSVVLVVVRVANQK